MTFTLTFAEAEGQLELDAAAADSVDQLIEERV